MKEGFVYIMANRTNQVVYTGVTSNLQQRVWEHRNRMKSGFSSRYHVTKLVYYESFDSIEDAIHREKLIKGGSRGKKEKLIETMNPGWRDLYEDIYG